jgi:hypothetical protein
MNKDRNEKWQQLIDLLEEADTLQQELLGNIASYKIHSQLSDIVDELTDFANLEGCDIA